MSKSTQRLRELKHDSLIHDEKELLLLKQSNPVESKPFFCRQFFIMVRCCRLKTCVWSPCSRKDPTPQDQKISFAGLIIKRNIGAPKPIKAEIKEKKSIHSEKRAAELKEKARRYRKKHAAELKEYHKIYRATHINKIKEHTRKYRETHAEKIKEHRQQAALNKK